MLANEWVCSSSLACKGRVEEAVAHISKAKSQQEQKYG